MKKEIYIRESALSDAAKEAYKALRANMQFCLQGREIKTVTVTSYNAGEGKTTTCINLAVSMAQAGMNVLFVDADLRKPMLYKDFSYDHSKGLSNFLMGQTSLSEVIYGTNIKGLDVICCGAKPLNPGELLLQEKFSDFLQTVKKDYDRIIIDTPPLGSVIDSAVIAAQTDGTLIVVASNVVKAHHAKLMKEQLEKVNANILGVVLNKVVKRHYKYYYGEYDYYGSHKKNIKKWLKKNINKRK